MPTITVSAILFADERILLARSPDGNHWQLPGGLLTETDATVEDALVRALAAAGVPAAGVDFLDTVYERLADEVVVHNVFAVAAEVAAFTPIGTSVLRWAGIEEVASLPLASWLAEALPALLAGQPAPGQEPNLAGLAAMAGVSLDDGSGAGAGSPPVWIITGPAGAGKSTLSRALCTRLGRAAHIEVDRLWDMVVAGGASPVPGASDPGEARAQAWLARLNAAALATNFVLSGFHAVIDDVLERPEDLDEYLEHLGALDPAVVTLLPDERTLRQRDAGRAPAQHMGQRSLDLCRIIAGNGETRGLRLDNSGWSVDETLAAILERLPEARVPHGKTLQDVIRVAADR